MMKTPRFTGRHKQMIFLGKLEQKVQLRYICIVKNNEKIKGKL